MSEQEQLHRIQNSLDELKATEVVTFDLKGKSDIADYMIIASGTSRAHLAGIADKVYMDQKEHDILPLGVEGQDPGNWILMDYNDVIVHLFVEEERQKYNLEELFQGRHPQEDPEEFEEDFDEEYQMELEGDEDEDETEQPE